MQGGELAVVDISDLLNIMSGHPNMKVFRANADEAWVQRESGDVTGIARVALDDYGAQIALGDASVQNCDD